MTSAGPQRLVLGYSTSLHKAAMQTVQHRHQHKVDCPSQLAELTGLEASQLKPAHGRILMLWAQAYLVPICRDQGRRRLNVGCVGQSADITCSCSGQGSQQATEYEAEPMNVMLYQGKFVYTGFLL